MWEFVVGTAVLFALTYIAAVYGAPRLLNQGTPRVSIHSLVSIFILSLALSSFSMVFPEWEFGNRLQHALGGGALVVFLLYRALRDTHIALRPLQFIVLGVLVASTLGVGYELLEFLGEVSTPLSFQTNSYDTWLDLLSNTVGALGAASILAYLLSTERKASAQECVK